MRVTLASPPPFVPQPTARSGSWTCLAVEPPHRARRRHIL